jgi:hypothetical protein
MQAIAMRTHRWCHHVRDRWKQVTSCYRRCVRGTWVVLSLGAIAGAAACKSSDDAPHVSAATAAAPAGRVLEVAGSVTVAGKPLVKGDTVVASAVIDTGADGSIVIELLHNLARWELGPNKHVRVDESLAWREPKRTEPAPQIDHEMSSAGRPAERMAAETAVTATTQSEDEGGPAAGEKRPLVEPPTPVTKKPPTKDGTGLGTIGTIGHGGGGGTGQGYGAGGGSLGGSTRGKPADVRQGDPTITGGLPSEVVKRIVRQHVGQLRMCYETGLKSNPNLEGKVVVTFEIGADGAVLKAAADSSTIADAKVVACVVNVFQRLSFPTPEGGNVSARFPIVLVHP